MCPFSPLLFSFQTLQCFYIFNLKKNSPFLNLDGGGEQTHGRGKVMSVGESQGSRSNGLKLSSFGAIAEGDALSHRF